MSAVTVNSRTYSDDSNPVTGLGNGGHRTRLIPLFSDALVEMSNQVVAASQSYRAASSSAVLIGPGSKSFVVTAGKGFAVGDQVLARQSANPSNFMAGVITAFDPATGALTLSVAAGDFGGSGSISDWVVTGPIGPRGLRGLAGFSYGWDAGTSAADPGAGLVRANAAPSAATALYIDQVDALGVFMGNAILAWANSTSAVKGRLILRSQNDLSQQIVYDVTSVTDNSGWFTIGVTYRGGAASFPAGTAVAVDFSRTGDKGDKGDTGNTGPAGAVSGAPDGAITTPGLAFASETGLGLRRKAASLVAVTAAGSDLLELRPATLAEAQAGTNPLVVMTPQRVANAISALGGQRITRVTRDSGVTLGVADAGRYIDITSTGSYYYLDNPLNLGAGWSVILGNSSPNGENWLYTTAGLIDSRSWIGIYPGEIRLIFCDGANFTSRVLNPFRKVFTSSDTFYVPPGYREFGGLAWSGGASGRKLVGGASGGGGGGCFPFVLQASALPGSFTITVGAGGSATSQQWINPGGDTSVGGIFTVLGAGATEGGSIRTTSSVSNHFMSHQGGNPFSFSGGSGFGSSGSQWFPYAVYGGGKARDPEVNGTNGDSVYGGGAGGGVMYDNTILQAPGVSNFGGSGGAAGITQSGSNGLVPGGGGGGTVTGATAGAGARGEVRIWGIC